LLRALRPDHPAARQAAEGTSMAATDGLLWVVLSTAAAVSPATRRAGTHGLLAWAVSSGAAMGIKRLTTRRRPIGVRRGGPSTKTSSMPSSHTAGAFAYATAATLALPPTGVVLVPTAALVAWSRVATARHFPTDLLVGVALGVATGAAVHVALRPGTAELDADQ
jgi:membrane-associated phospholipid phosphatase